MGNNFKSIFKKPNLYTTDENLDNNSKIEGEGSNTENDSDFRSLLFGLKDNKSNYGGGAFLTQYKLRKEQEKAQAEAENTENEKQSEVVK